MKKIFHFLMAVFLSFPAYSHAVPTGGAGSGDDSAYVLGGSDNTLGSTSISSSNFVSGLLGSGFRITAGGEIEAQNITARGTIRTSVFEKDTISVVNGFLLIASGDVLDADMTALDASTLTIKGNTTFVANEVLRIKDGNDDEWLLVTDAGSAPTYTVTRDLAGSYTADNNPIWTTGTSVTSMGVGTGTTTGFLLLDASSANSPFMDIYARNSNTYNDYSLKARLGWLQGIVDADVGLNSTDVWGLYSDSVYLKGTIVAESGKIGGWTLGTYEIKDTAGNTGMNCDVTGGDDVRFWAGSATPSSAPFNVTEAGVLTATSGTVGGWTLGSTTLTGTGLILDAANQKITAGTGNDIVTMDASDATHRLAIGHATMSSAPFRVTKEGAVTATSGSIGGFTLSSTTLANGTDLILDASNKAISINDTTYGNSGIQLQYNSGTPRFYVGDGSNKYLKYDGTNLGISVDTNDGTGVGVIYKGGSRWLYDFDPAHNGTVNPSGYNTFLGVEAGNLTMGSTATNSYESSNNVGVGYRALLDITTGYDNSAIGEMAMRECTTCEENVSLGTLAMMGSTSGFTGGKNVGIGKYSLYQITSGDSNVAIGDNALMRLSSGSNNIGIGTKAGYYQSDGSNFLSTPENSIYIGKDTNSGSDSAGGEDDITNEIVIGYSATGNGANTITFGNTSISEFHAQVALTVDSDRRIKDNITALPSSLEFIDSLKPVSFTKINPADYPEEIRPVLNERPDDDDQIHLGLIAQDLEKTLKAQSLDWGIVKTGPNGKKSITYESLIIPMIKAVQELSAKIAILEGGGM